MIDFKNKKFLKLKPNDDYGERAAELLVANENIVASYKSMRDGIVFTNKRMIIVNKQGITGKKVDYTSIPYSKINVFSVETAGTFDIEAELQIYISGMGMLEFEFGGKSNIKEISKHIAQSAL